MIRLSDKKPSHIIAFTVRKADLISIPHLWPDLVKRPPFTKSDNRESDSAQ